MTNQEANGKRQEAVLPKLYERGTWLHERDGDLNPTWIFVAIYLAIGGVVCVGALLSGSALAMTAALSFLGTVIVALLISALPIAKSKVLSRARLGESAIDAVTEDEPKAAAAVAAKAAAVVAPDEDGPPDAETMVARRG